VVEGSAGSDPDTGLAPAYAAARARSGVVAALFAVAGIGWVWTAREMQGMDGGPWTSMGSLGWFLGVWIVMMAAMMFPSVAPTVALYAHMMHARSPLRPSLFAGGYLLTWAAAGVAAYALGLTATRLLGGTLAWGSAGRGLAGATLLVAAIYEITALKDVCLGKCRSPFGVLLGSWRDSNAGAVRMGAKNGAWCVGCCWALMASLFALGAMSVTWMAFVAAMIAVEKTVPWRRREVTYATSAVLLALGILVLTAPEALPALTIPSTDMMQTG
jgi:predicted metal-binding membrane protein